MFVRFVNSQSPWADIPWRLIVLLIITRERHNMSNEEKMTDAFFNDADVLRAIRSITIFEILSLKE